MVAEFVDEGIAPIDMFRVEFSEDDLRALEEALSDMKNPVEILLFTEKSGECLPCNETVKLLEVLREASPVVAGEKAIKVKVFDRRHDYEMFEKYGVGRVPTILLVDGVIRYLGMPAGEEVKGFVETLIRISTGDHGLSKKTVKELSEISGRIHIQVIVTPPCPYCPYAALMANMFAFVAKVYGRGNVISEIVEAFENPDVADMYGVTTVPTIVINRRVVFVGLPYEGQLLKAIKRLSKLPRGTNAVL